MPALLSTRVEPHWLAAIGLAAAAHAAAISAVLAAQPDPADPLPEPVMVVELPAGAAPEAALAPQLSAAAEPLQELPAATTPRIPAPEIEAPLPPERVALPTPRPLARNLVAPAPRPAPLARVAAPAPRLAPPTPAAGTGEAGGGPGNNTEASAAEADWYALISAHLNRDKRYPRDAKKAEQQGTPVVRFAVDRRGRVSDVSISRSSGHDVLDQATLELLRRVSPLPAMPRTMAREHVTITLPIEYSLSRK